jgi:hypothetical protein
MILRESGDMLDMKLIEKNTEHNYNIYKSDFVYQNRAQFLKDSYVALERFRAAFPGYDPTLNYRNYNSFSITSGSLLFYHLYQELKTAIRDYANTTEPLWFQSWMNFHKPQDVLDWHDHRTVMCHGYISIWPQDSKTIFREYEVDNEIGKMYIGPGETEHKVQVLEDYTAERITLAFDVYDEQRMKDSMQPGGEVNLSILPLL